MDVNLPTARSVFLPRVPEALNEFKSAVEIALARQWDNSDILRQSLASVTSGTIAGVVVVTASATNGAMITYASSGSTSSWGLIPAGSHAQFLRYDATSGASVWDTPDGPMDVSASSAGSLIVSTAGSWAAYPPTSSGSIFVINSSGLPAWTPVASVMAPHGVLFQFGMSPINVGTLNGAGFKLGTAVSTNISIFMTAPINSVNASSVVTWAVYKGQGMNTCQIAIMYGATSNTGTFVWHMGTASATLVTIATNGDPYQYGTFDISTLPANAWYNCALDCAVSAGTCNIYSILMFV